MPSSFFSIFPFSLAAFLKNVYNLLNIDSTDRIRYNPEVPTWSQLHSALKPCELSVDSADLRFLPH